MFDEKPDNTEELAKWTREKLQLVAVPKKLWVNILKVLKEYNTDIFNGHYKIIVFYDPTLLALIASLLPWARNNLYYYIDNVNSYAMIMAKDLIPEENIIIGKEKLNEMPKFYVSILNPKYQHSNGVVTGNHPHWVDANVHACNITEENGYICMVSPDSWVGKKPNMHNDYSVYCDKQIKHVEFFDTASRPFKEGTSVSWYIIQNKKSTENTHVIQHENGVKHDIGYLPFNRLYPIIFNDLTLSIHAKIISKFDSVGNLALLKSNDVHNQAKEAVSEIQDEVYKYKVHMTHPTSPKYKNLYTNKHTTAYEKWKVMIPGSSLKACFIDNNCATGNDIYLLYAKSKEEALKIQAIIKNTVFDYIFKMYKRGGNIHSFVRDCGLPAIDLTRNWSNSELYEYFNLTQEEINYVESVVG